MAIEVQGLEIQIGARTLLHPTNFHVAKGDKIGLVGRNGAGKTTLTRVITGDMLPTAGKVRVSGKLGYLPQDTHASDPTQTALDHMMSARDIATIINRIRKAEKDMTDPDPDVMSKAMTRYDKAMQDFDKAGGYAGQIDMYSLGWKAYLHQRVVDEERRRREREVAEKKADRLMKQGIRLHAKATKAVAAQNMMRRAEKLLENTSEAQKAEKVADIRFPEPAPCGRTPIMAKDISKAYGSNIVFAGVNLAIDKGSRVVILGYNGAGKTTTLRLLAHIEEPDTGSVEYGHGCKIGYFAQEHDTLDLALATLVTSRANVLLLDEPTNNLDPASREEILKAIAKYEGAIVLVTHDEGAVEALNPERVLLMPDGDEDLWNDSYLELVAEE